ncbi:hypothetical protein M514_05071 [Trichuris suis]|uniref:Uncharacterized protein n=1 Tax=Trichuris suis TaxID=68888 RepID=A0A085NCS4_9BILA|nr:hypothetical protein M513_05071 [Trichuris suis]KFD67270.1 hypothetical protein M514_05071 [Trichuris suis]
MSAVAMASELTARRFWPKALPAKTPTRLVDLSSLDLDTLVAELRSRISADAYQGVVSGSRPRTSDAVYFMVHKIDLSKLSDKEKWTARWARPNPSYYRPYSHLGLYKADGAQTEEVFWDPPLPTDRAPPYIVELQGAPDIVTSGGRFMVPFGVVVDTDYFKHFDVVPCIDWEHAFSYCATGDVEWTLRNSDTSLEMVEVPATQVTCIVERWWAFDVSDTGTTANPKNCGRWRTATAEGANDLVDASGCSGMFMSYERDPRTNTDANSAFAPVWLLRSSPHTRGWSATWRMDAMTLSMTGRVELKREPINRVLSGGTPEWCSYGYSVSAGSHLWRVAALLELFVADGAAVEFFDARLMSLVVKGAATLMSLQNHWIAVSTAFSVN